MARPIRTIAIAAVAAAAVTASPAVAPAQAHDGPDGDRSWTFKLSERAEDRIDARNIGVRDVGPASLKIWNRDAYFRFPVVATRYTRSTDDDRVTVLAGGVRFNRAQPETWRRFRVNEETNRITALVDGVRRPVLRFADECGGFGYRTSTGDYRGTALRLTVDGQASLDRAAGANAFYRGQLFGWAGGH